MSSNTNWYSKKEVKKHVTKYNNPHYDKIRIKHPFRMLIIGGSGSGKTTVALEIIKQMSDTFDFLILCVKSAQEPLYQYLIHKLSGLIAVYEDGKLPTVDEVKKLGDKKQTLIIFDDLVLMKDQKVIEEMFIRGRKIGNGVSMMYLTQSYYKTPKTIRINCNYIILKKLSSNRDLRMILREYDVGVSEKELMAMYNVATDQQLDFLLIRLDEPHDSEFKFTKNFNGVFQL
jgi:hypothetical protein